MRERRKKGRSNVPERDKKVHPAQSSQSGGGVPRAGSTVPPWPRLSTVVFLSRKEEEQAGRKPKRTAYLVPSLCQALLHFAFSSQVLFSYLRG